MTRLIDADRILKGKEDHDWISTHVIWNAPTVEAVPVEFISDYVKHKASPYGRIVINDMMKEWLNSKYGLGHNTNEVKGEE